jgi:hypothetical protein
MGILDCVPINQPEELPQRDPSLFSGRKNVKKVFEGEEISISVLTKIVLAVGLVGFVPHLVTTFEAALKSFIKHFSVSLLHATSFMKNQLITRAWKSEKEEDLRLGQRLLIERGDCGRGLDGRGEGEATPVCESVGLINDPALSENRMSQSTFSGDLTWVGSLNSSVGS